MQRFPWEVPIGSKTKCASSTSLEVIIARVAENARVFIVNWSSLSYPLRVLSEGQAIKKCICGLQRGLQSEKDVGRDCVSC